MRKIYVSATSGDLQSYRERVSKVIRRLGELDVSMDYYVAEDSRPLDRCLRDVADCDVYIGLFAWRYGWVPKENNPDRYSITELEYRKAAELGKPLLLFLLHEDAPWPRTLMDRDPTAIEAFRARLTGGGEGVEPRNCVFFKSEDHLASEVSAALAHLQRESVTDGAGLARGAALDIERYFHAFRQRYLNVELEALSGAQREEFLQLRLQSVYVEQSVRESAAQVELPRELWDRLRTMADVHEDDLPAGVTAETVSLVKEFEREYPPSPVLRAIAAPTHRHVIVLGNPGAGKSTLVRYLLLSLMDEGGDTAVRTAFPLHLPLLIELKSYVALRADGKCDTFLEYLDYLGETEGWGLSKEALEEHLAAGRPALVVFDGLDEIFDPEEREMITRRIVAFAQAYSGVRVVATSRVIGYRRKILTDAGFVHLMLQDFDETQVEEFVTKWFAIAMAGREEEARERVERITRAYTDSPSIRQLAGVPMLLTIMAIIGKNQELPRERWKLYDHAAGVLVQHWDVNKHLQDQNLEADFLLEDDKKELLRRLAYRMQAGQGGLAGNYIHRDDLLAAFESYLRDRFEQSAERAARISREMVRQFRERNYILSALGANLYGFVHRAFLEYFCASAIVYLFEKTNELSIDDLKQKVFGTHWQDRAWHEVLRLICGMVGQQFATELIDYLAADANRDFSAGHESIVLAAECLGELRNVAAARQTVERVTARLCEGAARFTHGSPTEAVAGAIGRLAPPAAVAEGLRAWLTARAGDRVYRNISFSAAHALARVLAGQPTLAGILEQALASADSGRRASALKVLAYAYPDDPAVDQTLRDVIRSGVDERERGAALFVRALTSSRPETRAFVRDWLAHSGETSGGMRGRAFYALRWLGEPAEELEPLARAEALPATRSWAVEAISEFPEAFDIICRFATSDPSPADGESAADSVRVAALQRLVEKYDAGRVRPFLSERAEHDPHPGVRNRARELLASLPQPSP